VTVQQRDSNGPAGDTQPVSAMALAGAGGVGGAGDGVGSRLLFDIAGIDLRAQAYDTHAIQAILPHRGTMLLLDTVVWNTSDWMRSLGVKRIRPDEFWVDGHFPGKPTFPGVMMIEAAAQLSAFAFLSSLGKPSLVLFLRIENAAFRAAAFPGDDLYILAQGVKKQRRRFITDVQGIIGGPNTPGGGKIAFEARLSGMMVEGNDY
jgi:3-hydroxyacyl-[acyl-carrier-protein] dehydratase